MTQSSEGTRIVQWGYLTLSPSSVLFYLSNSQIHKHTTYTEGMLRDNTLDD